MTKDNDEWVVSAKIALNWFIEHLGKVEWERRRKTVIDYFKSFEIPKLTEADVNVPDFEKLFHPVAVYDDWMSWYMYLIESLRDRPSVDDPLQSARIYPFFVAIGRNIDRLKEIPGIEERLKVILNERQNNPDSSLFEFSVANLYLRNGWQVKFLKEEKASKTPDFEVSKDGEVFWAECKRLAKVPGYADEERDEWLKRFKHLTNAMRILKIMGHVDVVFKIPVENTPVECLGGAFYHYSKSGMLGTGSWLVHEMFDFKVKQLDLVKINDRLSALAARENSPQMIQVITGEYDMHGNYTQLISPSEIVEAGPDDGLHVLNRFVHGIHEAYSAKWECVAESSIDKKAKDVRKILSKAVDQIPANRVGIVHIGYETVLGPTVELRRYEKIKEMIESFDFKGKVIEGVYCHAIQPLSTLVDWECAETTLSFERHPNMIFEDNLLLGGSEVEKRNATHWEEDNAIRYKNNPNKI